jgi:hypothetical protein
MDDMTSIRNAIDRVAVGGRRQSMTMMMMLRVGINLVILGLARRARYRVSSPITELTTGHPITTRERAFSLNNQDFTQVLCTSAYIVGIFGIQHVQARSVSYQYNWGSV